MGLADAIARRPFLVLAAALVVTALALVPAARMQLVTDVVALFPDGSAAADDYRLFGEQFGGFEKVFVLILGERVGEDGRRGALLAAAGELESLLAASPEVAAVRSGIRSQDEEFFLRYVVRRAPLLLAHEGPETLAERLEPEAIRTRVARLHAALTTPLGGFEAPLLIHDPLGLGDELVGRAAGGASLPVDPLTSTFLAPGGSASLVILTPARAEIDPEGGRALMAELERAYAEVRQRVDPELQFFALGGPLYAAQDEALLREDLSRTVTGSAIGVSVLLLLAFEGVLIPLAALAALGAGLVWTGAWMGATSDGIAAVGLGFAAVLIGLGIDYGIHGGARYRDLRLQGHAAGGALGRTFRHTGPGILTSAATTAVGFATLSLAHFRPLRELGQLVAVGIVAILVASATVGAAIVVLARPGRRRPGLFWRAIGRGVEAVVGFSRRHPRRVVAAAVVVSLPAGWGLSRLTLNPELTAIRPDDHPAMVAERLLVEHFALGLDTATVVVPGADLGQVLERSAAVARRAREAGGGIEVTSPSDWLTGEASAERLRALAVLPWERAAGDLERELRAANLNPRAFAPGLDALRALARGEDPGAPGPEVWPDGLGELIRLDPEGPEGARTWAAVRLRLPKDRWPDGPPAPWVGEIKALAPGSAVASMVAIGDELGRLARRDLRTLGVAALALVAVVVLASFRGRPGPSVLAVLPVLLGSLWGLGLWGAVGRSLDLLSLAVVPIMLGIGIDDGLHALHGARRAGRGEAPIAAAVGAAGRAMVLTTLTTCVGFGSLALSRVPGLRHGGMLVAIGVFACLAATLCVLPALEGLRRRPEPSH